jgi:hypothetical protein
MLAPFGAAIAQTTVNLRGETLSFEHGLPTREARQKLFDELDLQRAVQAVLWAEPAVNNYLFRRAQEIAGAPNLGTTLYDQLQQPGHECLTPNQAVVYEYTRVNLRDTGPVVYVLPPGPINGGFFDMWMRPFYDMGAVGPNEGRGDRILLVPPGYQGTLPSGYQIARPLTYEVFTITRVPVTATRTKEAGTELLKKIEVYPLSEATNPKPRTVVLMGDPAKGGKEFRMNRPKGLEYWKIVHDIINTETVESRDRINLGALAAIGIEAGQPFSPDARKFSSKRSRLARR